MAEFDISDTVLVKYNGCARQVTVPENVSVIGDGAFDECTGVESITVPHSIMAIQSYAFDSCESLKSVILGSTVDIICGFAFYHCASLRSVTFKGAVSFIGSNAFDGCSGLKQVILHDSWHRAREDVFGRDTIWSPERAEVLTKSFRYWNVFSDFPCIIAPETVLESVPDNDIALKTQLTAGYARLLLESRPPSAKVCRSYEKFLCENTDALLYALFDDEGTFLDRARRQRRDILLLLLRRGLVSPESARELLRRDYFAKDAEIRAMILSEAAKVKSSAKELYL